MNELININGKKVQIKEYQGYRVITLKDVDVVHERAEGTAGRNFRENRYRFIEGIDFFQRNSSEAKGEFNIIAPNGIILLTESGYLMLVKSLTDDLAWKVQRELINNYFRKKQDKPSCIEDVLIQSLQEMKQLRERTSMAVNTASQARKEVQAIKDIIIINPKAEWRDKTNKILKTIGYQTKRYKDIQEKVYKVLEQRGACNLKQRLKNLQGRALLNGMSKTQAASLNNLDVIENDARLKEIYIGIVKEIAIKYGVKVKEAN